MRTVLHIENLDCPVCAEALQGDIQKMKGVSSVLVEYVTQTITLEVENEEILKKVVKIVNGFEEVRVVDEGGMYATNPESHKKEWLFIGVAALLFVLGFLFEHFLSGRVFAVLSYIVYSGAYLAVGHPVLLSTAKNVVKGRVFDENFLMTVASVGAIALGEVGEGAAVMLLYQLGELLQSIAVGSSRKSVADLMALKSERATRLEKGEWTACTPETLQVGDIVLVKAGERTPADGVLQSEYALLDTKSLTGEAELRKVKTGEEILSGSINAGYAYEMRVLRPYEDSTVGRILDLVENASAGKAKPEKFIAKFAKIYTPVVCALALLLAIVAPLVNGLIAEGRLYFSDFSRWVQSALTFLVISCPCALVISVPLTYFLGIGSAAKQGILVKGASYLDVLAKANVLALDKTGTLTEGNFTVRNVYPVAEITKEELLAVVCAVEKGSAHPIASAFAGMETSLIAEGVTERSGKGLTAKIDGEEILVGNMELLAEEGITFEEMNSAYTLVFAAKGGTYLGAIELGDTLRKEAKEVLEQLKALGLSHSVMLTGDGEERAKVIANEVGMYEVKTKLMPDDKLRVAEEYKQKGTLLYVGDGINDAPVMMAADCAVSMGKLGSAAAVEASDLVLIADDLRALPKAVKLARKTRAIVVQNIIFSIVMKVAFMVLGAAGVLPLWLAVFADVGVMLLAVCNAFRVRFFK